MLKKLKEWWKKRKIEKKTVAHIKYLVDKNDQIYIDYKWNKKLDEEAVSVLAMLFFNISSGEMSDDSISFIQQNCAENGLTEEFKTFSKTLASLRENLEYEISTLTESLIKASAEKSGDEVVVKPTDIGIISNKGHT
tara:strand:- start:1800 stop:2210 length:411 start_codon:yes stop_codon:yes gene_type:complete